MEKMYCLYDKKKEEYCNFAFLDERFRENYFIELANSPDSNCYGLQSEFITCYFDMHDDSDINLVKNGNIAGRFIFGNELLSYVDEKRINYQNMIKVLNYLPVGYFKMPAEMQKEIKEQIDEAVKEYARYLVDNSEIVKEDKTTENT